MKCLNSEFSITQFNNDVYDFFEHLDPSFGPIIEIVNNSWKGRKHIEVFKLNKGWNFEQREMFSNTYGLISDIDTENIIGDILAKSYQIN